MQIFFYLLLPDLPDGYTYKIYNQRVNLSKEGAYIPSVGQIIRLF